MSPDPLPRIATKALASVAGGGAIQWDDVRVAALGGFGLGLLFAPTPRGWVRRAASTAIYGLLGAATVGGTDLWFQGSR